MSDQSKTPPPPPPKNPNSNNGGNNGNRRPNKKEKEPGNLQRINHWAQRSVTVKLFSIGILILALIIPSSMISSLIYERQHRQDQAIQEISSKWGHEQLVSGPILSIPYKRYFKDDGEIMEVTEYAHFLPEQLNISGDLNPNIRARGIYEAVLYNTKLNFAGNFEAPSAEELALDPANVQWDQAFLSVGIPDMRGINENIQLKWNDSNKVFEPGIATNDVLGSGVSVRVPIGQNASGDGKEGEGAGKYNFNFDLDLNGSQALNFVPLGKETLVNIKSDWPDPSFDGAFIPDDHVTNKEGFNANYKILHLNRNYPQQWKKKAHKINHSAFGVKMIRPVDQYSKTNRSAKYAIMFIFLTFTGFFFVEILNRTRIHPLQYLLVGIALCVFYLLLLSISEHINFNNAYFIATASIVAMITLYCKTIFKSNRLTLVMGITLLGLYGFLYSLLQLQDYALLMGSIGLFVFLAGVMYLSRNIDWYNLQGQADIDKMIDES